MSQNRLRRIPKLIVWGSPSIVIPEITHASRLGIALMISLLITATATTRNFQP